jgi:hypothetical protein
MCPLAHIHTRTYVYPRLPHRPVQEAPRASNIRSLTYCRFPSARQARKGNIGHLYCGYPSAGKIVQVIILHNDEIEYKTIDTILNHPYGVNNIYRPF